MHTAGSHNHRDTTNGGCWRGGICHDTTWTSKSEHCLGRALERGGQAQVLQELVGPQSFTILAVATKREVLETEVALDDTNINTNQLSKGVLSNKILCYPKLQSALFCRSLECR